MQGMNVRSLVQHTVHIYSTKLVTICVKFPSLGKNAL